MTTKVSIDEFVRFWSAEMDDLKSELPEFAKNMLEDSQRYKTYAEWIAAWLVWSDLSTEEDIERNYGF